MSDESASTGVKVDPPAASPQESAGTSKVPLHELLTERGKRQTAETELATVRPLVETLTQRAEKAEAAAAAAQEKAGAYEAREKAEREAVINALPEADRVIAQAITDPTALTAFAARVSAGPKPPVNAGTPGGAGQTGTMTPAEIAAGVAAEGLAFLEKNRARMPG